MIFLPLKFLYPAFTRFTNFFLFIVFIILLNTATVFAQSRKARLYKIASTYVWKDSIWDFNNTTLYDYDQKSNVIAETVTDEKQINYQRWTHHFDIFNNETENVFYAWQNNLWQPLTRTRHEYDQWGNLTLRIYENRDTINNGWLDNGTKLYLNQYDHKNRVIETIEQEELMGNVFKEQFIYENDTIKNRITFSWHQYDSAWALPRKSNLLWLKWNGDYYNSLLLADTNYHQTKATFGDSSFYPEFLRTYITDTLKNMYVYTIQDHFYAPDWYNDETDTLKWDQFGNDTAIYYYKWDNNQWKQGNDDYRYFNTYDSSGDLISTITQQSSPVYPDFKNYIKQEFSNYFYAGISDPIPEDMNKDIVIYPNPVDGNKEIYLRTNVDSYSYKIYSANGIEVCLSSYYINKLNEHLSSLSLKSINSGIYYIIACPKDNKQSITKKIIITE